MADAPLERHCGTCAWYRPLGTSGRCHRFPPPASGQGLNQFPLVSADSFCGEYERA